MADIEKQTNNYFCYHMHSDLSNAVTNIDSVTKFNEYVNRAKELGMRGIAFSEHGSCFEWYHKKTAVENAGMKYVHGVEAYITETLDEKIRDNMHCILLAKNYDGFLELNRIISRSFNRKDNHFYYVPRISLNELFNTTDNIIITTACVGGILGKGNELVKGDFLDFAAKNKERVFLEIGHHIDEKQVTYNKYMYELSKSYDLKLIAGTDTHVLNETHEIGRSILQKSKNIIFEGEDNWDLKFKSYEELISAYKLQSALPEPVFMEAIANTNLLLDLIEEFQLDTNTKYPHIYEKPEETFCKKIEEAEALHPYALKNHTKEELDARVAEELEVYKATKSIDFMLLQTYLRDWEKEHGIQCGYSRGSVSGSMIAYLLGITQMDSMKFDLNFFRFMNPSRVTNADIDTDYAGDDREKVKQFLLRDKLNIPTIKSSEIITFNTIALKGAVRDVSRAIGIPLDEVATICSQLNGDDIDESLRKKYKELFDYVDIVNGTIVSVGTHPSGVLISDLPIDETIGMCSIASSEYPVSMLNMKELDALMYVKLDVLGLDNIGVINETCKEIGIERLTPDNVDLEDEDVWKSIRDDTTLIFQWESNSAQAYIKRFMSDKTIKIAKDVNKNFSYIKWLSFGNGLIRPGCASFRDNVARGEINATNFPELNDALAKTFGRITMQEDIMQFCKNFCGYSDAESDNVRRGIAKKKGTAGFVKEIHDRFLSYSSAHYGINVDELEKIFPPIEQGILDASDYAFSWNHSDSYSMIGYICGYLRYYYPFEFLTAALNIFSDDTEKTAEITKYAKKINIEVTMPKWGISKSVYAYDKNLGVIAKNLTSIKYMNSTIADELYTLAHNKKYKYFVDVLSDIDSVTSLNARQLDILIKIDFFSEFGNQRELLRITDIFYDMFKCGQAKKISREKINGTPLEQIVEKYAVGINKNGSTAKSYTLLDVTSILREAEDAVKSLHLDDLSDILKVRNFADVMGYIGYISGKEEDRRKLYVTGLKQLKRKKDGKQFGYSVMTKSIGSGKEARFTVFNKLFNEDPIKENDIIYITSFSRDGQYFNLTGYHHIY